MFSTGFFIGTCQNESIDEISNDPDYNFMEDKEEIDKEDFRDDRAVKVSSKCVLSGCQGCQ